MPAGSGRLSTSTTPRSPRTSPNRWPKPAPRPNASPLRCASFIGSWSSRTCSGRRAAGFDAILGNPPWDIAKPVSKEFFSNIDPLYRSYGKQEALRKQTAYFEDELVEGDWLDYSARFRAQSNFTSHAASPFGDPAANDKSEDRFTIVREQQKEP